MNGTVNIRIAYVIYNSERFSGLIIKFKRPIQHYTSPDKKVTIKVMMSGKINFDGGNSEIEIRELYYWIKNFFCSVRDKIFVNINNVNPSICLKGDNDENCSDSGESIYDD